MMFISHDLGVVAEVSDRVAVLYMGHVVEIGDGREVFADPLHPYTTVLISSVPRIDTSRRITGAIERGEPPSRFQQITGCPFQDRCSKRTDICAEMPALRGAGRAARRLPSFLNAERDLVRAAGGQHGVRPRAGLPVRAGLPARRGRRCGWKPEQRDMGWPVFRFGANGRRCAGASRELGGLKLQLRQPGQAPLDGIARRHQAGCGGEGVGHRGRRSGDRDFLQSGL